MIGGRDRRRKHLDPIFKTLAAGARQREPHAWRDKVPGTRGRFTSLWSLWRGHFVKMVQNGIEYGLMAATPRA